MKRLIRLVSVSLLVVGFSLVTAVPATPALAGTPTPTTNAASSVGSTTATLNGDAQGNPAPTQRGFVWDTSSHGAPGDVAPVSSGYAGYWSESAGAGAFSHGVTSLTAGATYYYRAAAYNNKWGYGAEVSFLTIPAAPTNVAASDGTYTAKVTITWTKSTGATGYKVYEGANLLGTLGDVATYDDAAAPLGSISNAGTALASDGTSSAYVTLSLTGEDTTNGASRTYKVVAFNATGNSADSATDTGYRGVGAITYQWQRSSGDSAADYSNIGGATIDPYNDTGAPPDGSGRYYRCVISSVDASNTPQTSSNNRGNRLVTYTITVTAPAGPLTLGDMTPGTPKTLEGGNITVTVDCNVAGWTLGAKDARVGPISAGHMDDGATTALTNALKVKGGDQVGYTALLASDVMLETGGDSIAGTTNINTVNFQQTATWADPAGSSYTITVTFTGSTP